MTIERTFVWNGDRPDDRDEVQHGSVMRRVEFDSAPFELRSWGIRYRPGRERVAVAVYDEAVERTPGSGRV